MKKSKIMDSLPKAMLRLNEKLGGILIEKYGIYTLKFDNPFGKGVIKQYTLINNITVTDFEIVLNQDLVYNIGDKENNLLYFIYCTEGLGYFKSKTNEKYNKIEELRPGIIGCNRNSKNQINIKKDVPFILNLISINRDSYFKRFSKSVFDTNLELEKLLNSFDSLESKLYLSTFNLKISNKLREVKEELMVLPLSGLLKMESSYALILALHLEQFYKEIYEERPIASLTKSELQKIRRLTEYIIESPEIQHSINSLCTKITMSPAKLQEGFKGMHNTTVADFVRNIRIEKSEKLLVETDLNISEIVYTIGLTSRSYFCKIFKSKYDCSPKRYRKIIRTKPISSITT